MEKKIEEIEKWETDKVGRSFQWSGSFRNPDPYP